jgi:hypothetical protein
VVVEELDGDDRDNLLTPVITIIESEGRKPKHPVGIIFFNDHVDVSTSFPSLSLLSLLQLRLCLHSSLFDYFLLSLYLRCFFFFPRARNVSRKFATLLIPGTAFQMSNTETEVTQLRLLISELFPFFSSESSILLLQSFVGVLCWVSVSVSRSTDSSLLLFFFYFLFLFLSSFLSFSSSLLFRYLVILAFAISLLLYCSVYVARFKNVSILMLGEVITLLLLHLLLQLTFFFHRPFQREDSLRCAISDGNSLKCFFFQEIRRFSSKCPISSD